MITLPRVAGRIFGEPLAMERSKLDIIVAAVGPRLQGGPLDDEEPALAREPYLVGADGIAVIDICGTLVSRSSGMNAMSGMSSYADIAADFSQAVADPSVRGIILACDSPGGEVKGMFELADTIYNARGTKPICAVADCAASAAYLLASAADQIVVSQLGMLGSVGVIALHMDQSGADEKAGLKYTAIYAGDRKNDGNPHEPLSPEAQASMQARIDQVYGMFVSAVARNRGIDAAAVRDTQAALYMGADGVKAGLADRIGDESAAVKMITTAFRAGHKSIYASSAVPAASPNKEKHMVDTTAAETTLNATEAAPPTAAEIETLVANARAEGFADAAQISDLCVIAGSPALAVKFISEKKTVAQVRTELVNARAAEQASSEINTGVMPGADTQTPKQGTAKPWSEIMGALSGKRKVKN